jgi:hypothetical protein
VTTVNGAGTSSGSLTLVGNIGVLPES